MVYILFNKCGAELHPAFDKSYMVGGQQYRLDYPVKYLPKSNRAQTNWTADKIAHLNTWSKSTPSIHYA